MGIYVFSWKELRKYLIEDAENENSSNDFGKDVLPAMLNAGERMFAYPFEGYWKDVGTVESLWDANMDLLDPNLKLDLRDIYSKNPMFPPHYVSETATIKNSNISDGCIVEGEVENSILFPGVKIEKGAKVDYSIIMPNTVVKANADIKYSIVSENTVIGCNAVIGGNPEDAEDKDKWGIAVIGDDLHIGDNVVVPPAAMIGEDLEAE